MDLSQYLVAFLMRKSVIVLLISAITQTPASKPVDDMNLDELLVEGKKLTGELGKIPTAVDGVNKLNHVLDSIQKKIPAHLAHTSGLEQSVDSAVHVAFHPVETLEGELSGGWWDLNHLTENDSGWTILKTIFIFGFLYIAVGMCIMQKYFNARGIESVPHLSFWVSYPGLVADGAAFVADRLGFGSPPNTLKSDISSRNTFDQFVPL